MSVADDPRLLANTPRPALPPPSTGAGHPLHTPCDAQRMHSAAHALTYIGPWRQRDRARLAPWICSSHGGRRAPRSATSAPSSGAISGAAPRLGTSRRLTQWMNDVTALFGFSPLEQQLGNFYADVVLPSGRSLELQHVDIDPATIMRRCRDHSAHGAGGPIWWLDAPSMLMSSAGKGFEILA